MFQSSWGNQGQQQQQNPQSTFGAPNAFGGNAGTSTFGSTGFGQPQQQPQQPQQPQVNPMFGNLSAPATTAPSGGFSAFANSGTGAFGQNKPSQGFSAFSGGTGAFGGTSNTFGQPSNAPNTGTSIFGQPSTSNTSTGFGNTNAFAATKPTTSVFGSTSTTSSVNNGTGGTPYSPFTEKDPNTTSMLHYQAITCSPAYRNFSIEELRLQDYVQNRKTASSSTFGTTSAFGSTQPTNTGIFGAQPNQPSSTGVFGSGTTNTGGFGAFGQQANQPSTTQPGAGIFGSGSTFGQQPQPQQQPQQQQQPSSFNAFGQQQPQQQQPQQQPQQGGGIFSGTSAFGNTANKPGFGSTGTFGTTPTTGTSIFGGGSGATNTFGQTQQPQQQQPSIFGNTQPTSQNAFSALGNTQPKPSIFGNTPAGTTGTTGTGFNIFGNQNQSGQQTQQPTQQSSLFGGGGSGGSIFGNQATNQQTQQGATQPSTSIFGATQPATGGTNIFGNTGGGLFGSNTNQQLQLQQPGVQTTQTGGFGNLFGSKPAGTTPSLFSNVNTATQPQTSMFGKLSSNSQQPSLFGARPMAPGLDSTASGQTGLFGSTLGAPVNPFGASAAPQPSLVASIADPIGHDLPIFSMLPPGPRALDFDPSQQKKKQGFFVDSSTPPPPLPRQLVYAPLHKSFGQLTPGSMNGLASTSVPSFSSGRLGVLAVNGSMGPDDFLARSASPALGSGSRPSVKVIFDKKVETSEIFVKSGSPNLSRGGKVTFSPALSVAAREKDAAALLKPAAPPSESSTPTLKHPARNSNKFTAEPHNTATGDATLQEGDYYIKPDLATLKKASYDELSSFDGLIVGRVGYGEIHFLEPVDLTGLAKLGALLGEVIRFDDKECSVYPDSEEVDKPSPGSGLNVKARLILERCWATDKATREPIKDSSHPTAVKHLKRLKNMRDTHFESFDMDGGKWTFTVDHF